MRRVFVVLVVVAFLTTSSGAVNVISHQIIQETNTRKQSSGSKDPAQAPPAQDDKIQLQARLVSITVTVSDSLGRFVTGLQQRQFQVYDDGVKQEIAHFSDDDAPLTLGIIYDVSGSMSDLTSRSFQALRRLFDTSHQDDEYFIVAFNDRAQLVQDFTTSPDDIMSRVVFVKAKGSTALFDGVYLGLEKAKQGRHRKKALLIISDGEENSSRYSGRELREMLKESDVPVYSIGVSQFYAGIGVLQSLSGWSGGMTLTPADEPQTRDIYTRIALMLRHQYVIGFYPSDVSSPTDWHKVRIMINGPKGLGRLSLSYRNGYRSFLK